MIASLCAHFAMLPARLAYGLPRVTAGYREACCEGGSAFGSWDGWQS